MARRVRPRPAAGRSAANLIPTSRPGGAGVAKRLASSCSKCLRAIAANRWLSTEIVAFSPALGYASILEPARGLAD